MAEVELRVSNGASKRPNSLHPEWLDDEFLQLCMQSGENDPTIRILRHSVSLVEPTRNHHRSVFYRVSVEFKRRPRSRNILDSKPQEIRSLVVKMMPQCDEKTGTLKEAQVFEKEISMLSETIPSIQRFLGRHSLAPLCVYSQVSPETLIVMEDVKSSGYERASPTRNKGLDLDHSMHVMRSLADLHAGSIALYEKDPSSMKAYQFNVWCKEGESLVENFVERTVTEIADEVATWSGYAEKYACKIRGLRDTLLPSVHKAVAHDPASFNVLLHGDCWFNNLMFRYNSAGLGVSDLMFVDFHNSLYSSPAIDLQHFLLSSPEDDVRNQHQSRLLLEYHRTLTSTMKKLETRTKPPTFDDLQSDIDKRGAYGVLIAFTLLPIVVGDKTISPHILHDPEAEKQRRAMYSSENYKNALKKLLPVFDSKGLLS